MASTTCWQRPQRPWWGPWTPQRPLRIHSGLENMVM
jgi:hypothetical protein